MKPKIGLLPFYIELYDHAVPQARPRIEKFHATIASEVEKRGLDVLTSPICRIRTEFAAAVKSFEEGKADCIVTLHLAYSPSLESADVLTGTKLPIIVLDTTPTYGYGPYQDPDELMFNHGIHGVQDMCNMLIRKGKVFEIEAGHWKNSDVLDRIVGWAKAAMLASRMRHARVGRIGKPFAGMGDFAVPDDVLRSTIGIEVVQSDPAVIRSLLPADDDPEVKSEMVADLEAFSAEGLDAEAHRRTTRACLAVRRWIEQEQLTAFTMNFMEIDQASGLPTVPFLEASKAMTRGIGYAGEGDALTAAFVGALMAAYPDTSFTEMFCPDWAGNSIFLSHMGEMNLNLSAEKPRLLEKPFPWTDAENPVVAVGRFRAGKATLVDLAPGAENTYRWLAIAGGVLDAADEDRAADSVHGWFRPDDDISELLSVYSRAGGTHHLALVYGEVGNDVRQLGCLMDWDFGVPSRRRWPSDWDFSILG